jgi:NAD(P)-dependent dehydrogenase (short-subunit alcohol dehydrogenase family)
MLWRSLPAGRSFPAHGLRAKGLQAGGTFSTLAPGERGTVMDLAQASHAFITGGASGIGLAIADALAARGVAVTIADVDEAALAAVLADRTGRLRGQPLDVRDRKGWARAGQNAEAAFGPVDLLFNNAGIAGGADHLADLDPAGFDAVIATNLAGVFNGVSAFGAGLRARGRGHIVNTSSMQGMSVDGPGVGAYAAAKAGVIALSEVLRHEMAPHGVGVSAYCPGMTMTPMVARALRGDDGPPHALSASLSVAPMDAGRAAELVLRGIEQNRPYILTHPARRAGVEKRFAAIIDDFEGLVD